MGGLSERFAKTTNRVRQTHLEKENEDRRLIAEEMLLVANVERGHTYERLDDAGDGARLDTTWLENGDAILSITDKDGNSLTVKFNAKENGGNSPDVNLGLRWLTIFTDSDNKAFPLPDA